MSEHTEHRHCDTCTPLENECVDCNHKTGRRESDICGSHKDLTDEQAKNQSFKEQVILGVKITAFFALAFMGWIASSNYLNAKDILERQTNFEKNAKIVQVEHKQEVGETLKEMRGQVNELVDLVRDLKVTVEVFTKTSAADKIREQEDKKKAQEEREHNRLQIEELKK